MNDYYEIRIEMNEIDKLQYVGFSEWVSDEDSLKDAREKAIKVYKALRNGKISDYLNDSIYRPNDGHCITGVEIIKVNGNDGNLWEHLDRYSFEPYIQ